MRPGCHTAVVNAGLFNAAQQELDARRTTTKADRGEVSFPLRGKLICPGCRRPLCTYVVTHRRGTTTINYRYYRCRSTAGGRPPCRGIQFAAGEIEETVRGMLEEPRTWRAAPDLESADAERLAMIWKSFNEPTQDAFLPRVIERVAIDRRSCVVAVRLQPDCIERRMGGVERQSTGSKNTQTNTADLRGGAE